MTEPNPRKEPSREWFRDWFGEEYLELYPHRDEAEAARAVRLYLQAAPPTAPVLDLACGGGRHLRELDEAGVEAIGLDLSSVLLGEARQTAPGVPLVRADMRRLPFRDETFGGLTSFFTSFGYFPSVDEDRSVIRGVRRVLRPGGTFMLDFFNADRVRETLVPRDERSIGDRRVIQTREIVGDKVIKRIRVCDEGTGGEERRFEERVRLYGATDLDEMLEAEGLRIEARYGDYAGGGFDAVAERLILVGVAA